MSRRVWLSLGSNQGDRWTFLLRAVTTLRQHPDITEVRCSQVFQTAPVGGPSQGDYLNCVVELVTDIAASELLALAQLLESAAGRERGEQWGPRTLDVDIVAIEGEIHQSVDLVVPHSRAHERAFVVIPLAELADPAQVLGRATTVPPTQLGTVHLVAATDYPRGWPA